MINELTHEEIDKLLHELLMGVAIVDLDGNFVKANKTLLEILEYSDVELYKKKFDDVTHPQDIPIDRELLKNLRGGHEDSYELRKRYITKTGKIVNALLKVHKRIIEEKHTGYVSQVLPITVLDNEKIQTIVQKIELFDLIKGNWKSLLTAAVFVISMFITGAVQFYTAIDRMESIEDSSRTYREIIIQLIEDKLDSSEKQLLFKKVNDE